MDRVSFNNKLLQTHLVKMSNYNPNWTEKRLQDEFRLASLAVQYQELMQLHLNTLNSSAYSEGLLIIEEIFGLMEKLIKSIIGRWCVDRINAGVTEEELFEVAKDTIKKSTLTFKPLSPYSIYILKPIKSSLLGYIQKKLEESTHLPYDSDLFDLGSDYLNPAIIYEYRVVAESVFEMVIEMFFYRPQAAALVLSTYGYDAQKVLDRIEVLYKQAIQDNDLNMDISSNLRSARRYNLNTYLKNLLVCRDNYLNYKKNSTTHNPSSTDENSMQVLAEIFGVSIKTARNYVTESRNYLGERLRNLNLIEG